MKQTQGVGEAAVPISTPTCMVWATGWGENHAQKENGGKEDQRRSFKDINFKVPLSLVQY